MLSTLCDELYSFEIPFSSNIHKQDQGEEKQQERWTDELTEKDEILHKTSGGKERDIS